MDRRDYWELCRRVALIPQGPEYAKPVPEELHVVYDGIEYYPVAYEVRWDSHGEPYQRAIMHDLAADSTTVGELERVRRVNE